jgi:serine/threonine-protein kinase
MGMLESEGDTLEKSAKIGKYEILGTLGQGPHGIVYKARDPVIERFAVLKIFTKFTDNPALWERFHGEATRWLGGMLQHPNIAVAFEQSTKGNGALLFIAREYLEGETLETMIGRQAPLPLAQKVNCMAQICGALDHAHKHDVLHLDIKPGNILFTGDGIPKVVDFGMRYVPRPEMFIIHIPRYFCPQGIQGKRADKSWDIWALGELFYEFLSYKRAFHGDGMKEVMMKVISEEPRPLHDLVSEIPVELEDVVSKMLRKEISERYQNMEAVLNDLQPIHRRLNQHSASASSP